MTEKESIKLRFVYKGGPGSGHHGHSGRPGKRGGSLPGGGTATLAAVAGLPEDTKFKNPDKIENLAEQHKKGILTDVEFADRAGLSDHITNQKWQALSKNDRQALQKLGYASTAGWEPSSTGRVWWDPSNLQQQQLERLHDKGLFSKSFPNDMTVYTQNELGVRVYDWGFQLNETNRQARLSVERGSVTE